jgi:hypothetical protein
MQEILFNLPPNSLVLDLGCQMGSFDAAAFAFATVRVDLRTEAGGPRGAFVQADAAKLPFRQKVFDAVICNHGLEHFKEPGFAMQEIGRVLKRDGALFVSVPDATTFQDRLYRWLAKGGGHVNLFDNPGELARKLTWYSGLPHVAAQRPRSGAKENASSIRVALGVPTLGTDLGIPILGSAPWHAGEHLRLGNVLRQCARARGPAPLDQRVRTLWAGTPIRLVGGDRRSSPPVAFLFCVSMPGLRCIEFLPQGR